MNISVWPDSIAVDSVHRHLALRVFVEMRRLMHEGVDVTVTWTGLLGIPLPCETAERLFRPALCLSVQPRRLLPPPTRRRLCDRSFCMSVCDIL